MGNIVPGWLLNDQIFVLGSLDILDRVEDELEDAFAVCFVQALHVTDGLVGLDLDSVFISGFGAHILKTN